MLLTARARSGTLPLCLLLLGALLMIGLLPISPTMQYVIALAMAWAIAAIGLDVFFGYLGQGSFGQAAFVAIGAYGTTILRDQGHWPLVLAVAGAVFFSGLVALLFAVVMVRLQHFGFVISTFFLSFVTTALLGGKTLSKWTGGESGLLVSPVSFLDVDFTQGQPLYYLVWALLLVTVLLSTNLVNGRWGRSARLIKRSELVAGVLGVRVQSTKVTGFVYAGMLAGLAGFLISIAVGALAPESFSANVNIYLFGMSVVGGLGSIAGPIIGSAFFTVLPQLILKAGAWNALVFAAALLLALVIVPEGIYGLLERLMGVVTKLPVVRDTIARYWPRIKSWNPLARAVPQMQPRSDAAVPAKIAALSNVAQSDSAMPAEVIQIEALGVSFSGIQALRDIKLSVRKGSVHAVIGPNGAGKTTLLNCITGVQRYQAGQITILGQPISGLGPAAIRRLGVARTFQNPSIVPDLTALENVKLGLHTKYRWTLFRDLLGAVATRRLEELVTRESGEALSLVGMSRDRWDVPGGKLGLAEQKLIDLARAIVGGAGVVLLDEPTSGLSDAETEIVATLLQRLQGTGTYTFVVISHSVHFVASLANKVTVLDFGAVLAEGTPAEVVANQAVADAFLGQVLVETPA
jgi:branched-chain amino acid transport system permease protein